MFVVVDDYSRFTWVAFLAHKNDTFDAFVSRIKKVQNEKGYTIGKIRSDHDTEFEESRFAELCDQLGVHHSFSAPKTPQHNGVAERKNRFLIEMSRRMMQEYDLPKHFWGEAVSTACYVSNRVFLRPILNKTPFEL